jgi:hypothetical protein
MAANGLSTRKQQSNGNQGITPAKSKIAARQSEDRAGHLKNRGAATLRSRRPKEKSRHGNLGIAPAKREIAARQSGDRAGQKKNHSAAI